MGAGDDVQRAPSILPANFGGGFIDEASDVGFTAGKMTLWLTWAVYVCLFYYVLRWSHDHEPVAVREQFTTMATLFLQCALNLVYGLLRNDSVLVEANSLGVFVGTVSIICLGRRVPRLVHMRWGFLYGFIACVALQGFHSLEFERALELLGGLALAGTVAWQVIPLCSIPAVIRTGSVASIIPFPPAAMQLLNNAAWALYGHFVLDDFIVWGPNLVGTVASFPTLYVHTLSPDGRLYDGSAGPAEARRVGCGSYICMWKDEEHETQGWVRVPRTARTLS
jgi:hypothetical protein